MGIKEWFTQTVEDIDGRFKNPLILSFILVWLFRHWELIYTVFNFSENEMRFHRISYISRYIARHGFYEMVLVPLLLSFVSLFVFYLIGIAAQIMKLWVGKRLSAQLMGKYDTGTFEFKTVADKYKKRSETYFNELRDKEEELSKLKTQTSSDEKMIMTLQEDNITKKNLLDDLKISFNTGVEQNKDLQNRLTEVMNRVEIFKKQNKDLINEKQELESRLAMQKNSIKIDSNQLELIFKPNTVWEYYIGEDNEYSYVKYDAAQNAFVSKMGKVGVVNVRVALSSQYVSFDKVFGQTDLRTTNLVWADATTLVGSEDGIRVKYIRTMRTDLL